MLKNPANCTCSEPVSLHLSGRNRLRTNSLGAVETNTQGWAGLGQRSVLPVSDIPALARTFERSEHSDRV